MANTDFQNGFALGLASGGVTETVKQGDEWELINTITLTEDVATVLFDKDSDGNDFTLKSFYVKCKLGVTTPSSAKLMFLISPRTTGSLTYIIKPSSVASISTTIRTWGCGLYDNIAFMETQSLASVTDYPNSNVPNSFMISIPPYNENKTIGVKRIAISAIKSSITDFDNIVEGSTFELWGVRK